jgi:hypothetical protein
MSRAAAALLATALLLLGACSREAKTYEDAASLARALDDAGIACESLEPGPRAELVSEQATCTSGEDDLGLYLFDSEGDRDNWLKLGARIEATAVGPNWVVTGEASTVERAADGLNATYGTPSS